MTKEAQEFFDKAVLEGKALYKGYISEDEFNKITKDIPFCKKTISHPAGVAMYTPPDEKSKPTDKTFFYDLK